MNEKVKGILLILPLSLIFLVFGGIILLSITGETVTIKSVFESILSIIIAVSFVTLIIKMFLKGIDLLGWFE